MRSRLAAIILLTMSPVAAIACPDQRPYDDPCEVAAEEQAREELHLPLGADVKLVFRKVRIPGREFWYNERRKLLFGDPDGKEIFELRSGIQIYGSFPDAGDWYYLLGKYELTKAQAAVALGEGDLAKGLVRLNELSDGRDPDDVKLAELAREGQALPPKLMALPVRFLDWYSVQTLIGALNAQCFRNVPCAEMLPYADPEQAGTAAARRPDAARAFFRLPTEVEWEYAARGGFGNDRFDDIRPFNEDEIGDYAFIKSNTGPARIGRVEGGFAKPIAGGLYDMYGNLKEFVVDPFKTGVLEGRPGAQTARGASIAEALPADVRASRREEVQLYRFEQEPGQPLKVELFRPASVGIRLALGSKSVDSPDHRRRLEEMFRAEDPGQFARPGSTGPAPGQVSGPTATRLPPSALTVEPLQAISSLIDKPNFGSGRDRAEVKRRIEEVGRLIGRQIEDLRLRYAELAVTTTAEFGDVTIKVMALENTVRTLDDLMKKGVLNTANQQLLNETQASLRLQKDQQRKTLLWVQRRLDDLKLISVSDPDKTVDLLRQTPIEPGRDGALKRIALEVAEEYIGSNLGIQALAKKLNERFRDCEATMTDPRLCL